MIYSCIDDQSKHSYLANEGFKYFTFSLLIGPHSVDSNLKVIVFTKEVSLIIATPDIALFSTLLQGINKRKFLTLREQRLNIVGGDFYEEKVENDGEVYLKTLSPIIVRKSELVGGSTKSIFFSPLDEEFLDLVNANFLKKAQSRGMEIKEGTPLEIHWLGTPKKIKTVYKGFFLLGYEGKFLLKGKKEAINALLDMGMGERNSQGFGMLTIDRE